MLTQKEDSARLDIATTKANESDLNQLLWHVDIAETVPDKGVENAQKKNHILLM